MLMGPFNPLSPPLMWGNLFLPRALSSLRSALGISNKELATHTILRMFQSNPNNINNLLLFYKWTRIFFKCFPFSKTLFCYATKISFWAFITPEGLKEKVWKRLSMRPPMLKGLKMKQIEGKKGTNSAKMLLVSSWLGPALLVLVPDIFFFACYLGHSVA